MMITSLARLPVVFIYVTLIFTFSCIKCQESVTLRTSTPNGDYEPPEVEIEMEETTPGFISTLNAGTVINETKAVTLNNVTTPPSTIKGEITTISMSNFTEVTLVPKTALIGNIALEVEANMIPKTDLRNKFLRGQSFRNRDKIRDNLKTVTTKPAKTKKLRKNKGKPSHVKLKHSFISGPDWHDLIKQPKTMFSSKILSNDIQPSFSILNQFDEISFEQGWDNLKSKDKDRKESRKRLDKKKTGKVSKSTTVWAKQKFKGSGKLSKVRYPVEFRLSDILPNPEKVKLFSIHDDVKSKETTFQYNHPNAISPFRTIFRFGNFRKPSSTKQKEKSHVNKSNKNKISRGKSRKGKSSKKRSRWDKKKNRAEYKTKRITDKAKNNMNKVKRIPHWSSQTNHIRPNRKHMLRKLNHLKMNVEEMLFDMDHADVIPFLMMGVAVP